MGYIHRKRYLVLFLGLSMAFFVGLGGGVTLAATVWLTLITVYACKQPRLVWIMYMTRGVRGLTKLIFKSNDSEMKIYKQR